MGDKSEDLACNDELNIDNLLQDSVDALNDIRAYLSEINKPKSGQENERDGER